jgi:hypothetical protein
MWLRPKIYKENRQADKIIVENKNIQALMTKHFIRSFSDSLLLFRNNNIITQQQFIFVCINNNYKNILDLLKCYIVSAIQQNISDIGTDNVLSRTKIFRHCNYAFRVCICREQKYTVENKNTWEQTRKQFNVTQKQ